MMDESPWFLNWVLQCFPDEIAEGDSVEFATTALNHLIRFARAYRDGEIRIERVGSETKILHGVER